MACSQEFFNYTRERLSFCLLAWFSHQQDCDNHAVIIIAHGDVRLCNVLFQGDCSTDVHLITRERDELQRMLERFEKYMEDIQSNVKLLTAERDKLNVLYKEVRRCF
jgi:hypothetical protein